MQIDYDQNEVSEQSNDFTPIPNGKYLMMITSSDEKTSKAGNKYCAMTLQVCQGPYDGRLLWPNLNLGHPNPTVVGYARQELKSMQVACKQLNIKDTSQLHSIPMIVTVAVVKNKDTGEPENKIRKYEVADAESMTPTRTAPEASGAGDVPDFMK